MNIAKLVHERCNQDALTPREIARIMNLTSERIRLIEARALMKLKAKLQAIRLYPSDLYKD